MIKDRVAFVLNERGGRHPPHDPYPRMLDNQPKLQYDNHKRTITAGTGPGYPEIKSIDDLNSIVFDAAEDWKEGRISCNDALEIDRAVGLVFFDCYESVAGKFEDLQDRLAVEFMEAEDIDLAAIG